MVCWPRCSPAGAVPSSPFPPPPTLPFPPAPHHSCFSCTDFWPVNPRRCNTRAHPAQPRTWFSCTDFWPTDMDLMPLQHRLQLPSHQPLSTVGAADVAEVRGERLQAELGGAARLRHFLFSQGRVAGEGGAWGEGSGLMRAGLWCGLQARLGGAASFLFPTPLYLPAISLHGRWPSLQLLVTSSFGRSLPALPLHVHETQSPLRLPNLVQRINLSASATACSSHHSPLFANARSSLLPSAAFPHPTPTNPHLSESFSSWWQGATACTSHLPCLYNTAVCDAPPTITLFPHQAPCASGWGTHGAVR
ncbi:unnamed protein product [Closterium sp. Naga37s-1]|nr:unnamed protein product [Closterium sp. Naga37s-1]